MDVSFFGVAHFTSTLSIFFLKHKGTTSPHFLQRERQQKGFVKDNTEIGQQQKTHDPITTLWAPGLKKKTPCVLVGDPLVFLSIASFVKYTPWNWHIADIAHENRPGPVERKGSSPNQHLSGVNMLVLGRVYHLHKIVIRRNSWTQKCRLDGKCKFQL